MNGARIVVVSLALVGSSACMKTAPALYGGASPRQDAPPGPASGLLEWRAGANGVARMNLVGGDSPTELTAFRIRYPAGFANDRGAHFHVWTEHIIVMKGTIVLGFGETPDPTKVTEYGPGSFIAIPAGAPHYEWFRGEVELHVEEIGPNKTIWLTHSEGH
jgi:quercetin dioxygenase-like cupin family protein